MTEIYSRRARELFESISDPADPIQLAAIDCACGDDDSLRQEVDSLLRHASTLGEFLEQPAVTAREAWQDRDWIGRQLRGYRIVEKIGEGGMANVYRAERADDAFARSVAVKIMRHRRGAELESLFGRERKILADLEHPGVARLIDAGSTEEGIPFAILELVDGVAVTDYAEANGLGLKQRIELFCSICDVVEVAHRRLIVHRDLKPSNILVSTTGEIKLLDFGIAKLLGGDVLEGSSTRALTPNYASPEQLTGQPVSTSMDVYSLGVVLYQMVTGVLPQEWAQLSLVDAVESLQSKEPDPPSQRVTDGALPSMGISSDKLQRLLRGDIDTIVTCSLRRSPTERYGSVGALAADLRRHLAGEPIRARSHSRLYRAGKFLRRQIVALSLGLVVFVALASLAAISISRARQAQLEKERAELVTRYLVDAFQIADPRRHHGDPMTVRELLDQNAAELETRTEGGSELRATMAKTFGTVYAGLGQYDEAIPLLSSHVEHYRTVGRDDELELAGGLLELSRAQRGLGDLAAARLSGEEAADLFERETAGGSIEAALNLCRLFFLEGELDQAFELSRDIKSRLTAPDERSQSLLREALEAEVEILWGMRRIDEAESIARDLVTMRRERGNREPLKLARELDSLAVILVTKHRLEEAESLHLESLAIHRDVLGERHPDITTNLNNLAFLYREQGRFGEAETTFLDVLDRLEEERGELHPYVVMTLTSYAGTVLESGSNELAIATFERALGLAQQVWPDGNPQTAYILDGIGLANHFRGDDREAEAFFEKAAALTDKLGGEESLHSAQIRGHLAIAKHGLGEFAIAEELYRETIRIKQEKAGEQSLLFASAMSNFAEFLADSDRFDEAREAAETAAPIYREVLPENHWRIAVADSIRGAILVELGDRNDGEVLLESSYRQLLDAKGESNFYTVRAKDRLASAQRLSVPAGNIVH